MTGHIIRVYDFENTDLEPPAQVIEVGYCDVVQTDGGWIVQRPVSWLCGTNQPMSPAARAAHHIRAEEIAGRTPYVAADMWAHTKAAGVSAVAAHNCEHEAKFWGDPELPVICTYKAALRVWPDAPGHSNGVLRYWLEDQGLTTPDHDLTMPPHRAGPDAYVTALTLAALLQSVSAREMTGWTKEPRLFPTNPIEGQNKEKGKPWPEVTMGLLSWIANTATLGEDLRWNAQREIDRRRAH